MVKMPAKAQEKWRNKDSTARDKHTKKRTHERRGKKRHTKRATEGISQPATVQDKLHYSATDGGDGVTSTESRAGASTEEAPLRGCFCPEDAAILLHGQREKSK